MRILAKVRANYCGKRDIFLRREAPAVGRKQHWCFIDTTFKGDAGNVCAEAQMITYQDGTEVRVGDAVLIEHQRTHGIVTEVIDSASAQKEWSVDEPGVMLKSAPFGLVFWPVSSFTEDPPVLVSRKEI